MGANERGGLLGGWGWKPKEAHVPKRVKPTKEFPDEDPRGGGDNQGLKGPAEERRHAVKVAKGLAEPKPVEAKNWWESPEEELRSARLFAAQTRRTEAEAQLDRKWTRQLADEVLALNKLERSLWPRTPKGAVELGDKEKAAIGSYEEIMNPKIVKPRVTERPIAVYDKSAVGRKPANHRNERAKGIAEGIVDMEDSAEDRERAENFEGWYGYVMTTGDRARDIANRKDAYRRAYEKLARTEPILTEEWNRAVATCAAAERELDRYVSMVPEDLEKEMDDADEDE
ncbi:MAG: hypothetical protein WCO25_03680 [Candidatus Uhrbacteria bacterium]